MTQATGRRSSGSKSTGTGRRSPRPPRSSSANIQSSASASSRDEWTLGADGKPVNWLERVEGGKVNLVLEGEDPGLVAGAIAAKRINEYYKLLWRGRRGVTPFRMWACLDSERKEKL